MITKILRVMIFLASCSVIGQNVTVSGSVKDNVSDQPLPGVNIVVKNTTKGTTTDFDGNYSIADVPVNSILVFSYLGFVDQEIKVTDSSPINVVMSEDAQSLNEVVVIGYGTQRKELVSGAFSSLNSETINERNPVRVEEALRGNAAGVQVNSTSGSPGAALNIRIRGITTNGNNSPLVVVDGINIGSDLSIIDPNDIERMDIIKDASAAIYGVQGANGVILITTKSGKKGRKTKFTYNSYYAVQEAENQLNLMNNYEYAAYVNETEVADGNPIPYPNLQLLNTNTDWQDELFERAPMFSHSLSASGGSETVTYSVSANYFAQDGVIASDKSNFKRWSVRNNLGIDLTKNLKLNTFLLYTNIRSKGIAESSRGSALYYALNASPLTPIYDGTDGTGISRGFSYIGTEQGTEIINPFALLNNTFNEGYADRFTGKVELEYSPIDNLKITSRFNYNYSDYGGRSFSPLAYYGPGKVVNNVTLDPNDPTAFNVDRNSDGQRDVYGSVSENTQHSFLYTWESFINYNKSFGNHNFDVVMGTSIQSDKYKGFFGSGPLNRAPEIWDNAYLFNSQSIIQIVDGELTQSLVSSSTGMNEDRLTSLFGRLQYDFKNTYLFSAMLRRDASTKFGPNNRYAYFPSLSAGWVITNEDFFDSSIINNLKLRGSWGGTGSDKYESYRWLGTLGGEAAYPFGDMLVNGNAISGLANPDLKWEEMYQTNIGLDISLFNSKIDLTLDYYRKKTSNLLLQPDVSGLLGATAPG
ncbi:MAG TPA: SusC/RagA family TonB-linked outer membrane protein, partial [Aquaticitalea sp.]|nr:SusC/RagA family TonB-linked outer membrane protein [Aquaticitalea sp.]